MLSFIHEFLFSLLKYFLKFLFMCLSNLLKGKIFLGRTYIVKKKKVFFYF